MANDEIINAIPHKRTNDKGHVKLVPMIIATGNHDLGINSINNAIIPHNEYEPLFKHYYPQSSHGGLKIPDLANRKSYFHHLIGDKILILSLDSGYEANPGGEQSVWLESILSKYSKMPIKIAQYHEPMFSSCDYSSDSEFTIEGRKHWVPLFDKYNVTVVFENHSHKLKRTYPLVNGSKSETGHGTVYLGEGSWGATDEPCEKVRGDIIVNAQAVNHVWLVTTTNGTDVHAKAIGKDKEVLDEVVVQTNTYD